MNKKQKIFTQNWEKFVRKCLQDNIYPVAVLNYSTDGIYPVVNYYEIEDKQKKEILSSLNK